MAGYDNSSVCQTRDNFTSFSSSGYHIKAMQLTFTSLTSGVDKRGIIMMMKNKKYHLSRIKFNNIMLFFAICFIINVYFCCSYNFHESLDRTTLNETWAISENTAVNGDRDISAYFKTPFLNKNNSNTATIKKNICTIPIISAVPKELCLFLFLIITFLTTFAALFILLPDRWTLMNQKVRLDN